MGGACPPKISFTEWKTGLRKTWACRTELDVGLEGDQIRRPKLCQFGIKAVLSQRQQRTRSQKRFSILSHLPIGRV